MSPNFVFSLLVVALLSACAAPTESPAPAATSTATIRPTETSTFIPTETLTSTPEPTATPEPVVIQKEITFDLTNGETLTIPAFLLNNPSEDPAILEKQQIELIEKALQYIVEGGVAWGDMRTDRKGDETSPEDVEFLKSFFYLPDKQDEVYVVGFRLPNDELDDNKAFLVSIGDATNSFPGTIFIYRNNHEGEKRRREGVFLQVDARTAIELFENGMVRIPT